MPTEQYRAWKKALVRTPADVPAGTPLLWLAERHSEHTQLAGRGLSATMQASGARKRRGETARCGTAEPGRHPRAPGESRPCGQRRTAAARQGDDHETRRARGGRPRAQGARRTGPLWRDSSLTMRDRPQHA